MARPSALLLPLLEKWSRLAIPRAFAMKSCSLKTCCKKAILAQSDAFIIRKGTWGGWTPLSGFIADRKAAGGGVLVGTGTHFINRMLYWFGYPDSCSLIDDSRGGPESHCLASFRLSTWGTPIDGTLLLSKIVTLKPGLAIATDKGRIIFPMGRSPLYFLPNDRPGIRTTISRNGPSMFSSEKSDSQIEIENFIDACRGTAKPMVSGPEGLQSVKLIEELYRNRTALVESWTEIDISARGQN